MELTLHRVAQTKEETLGILFNEGTPLAFTMEDEYRQQYAWFTFHLELQNVNNFQKVYIHIGNTDKDTDGCILVAYTATGIKDGKLQITESKACFERLYKMLK